MYESSQKQKYGRNETLQNYASNSSETYSMKPRSHCCGSFSRGQRCVGCPG